MNYYGVKDLAEMFQVHPETIKREVQRNRLQCFKVGAELRFTQEHIDNYTNVVNFGKTTREIELEKMLEEKDREIKRKNDFIESVKIGILQLN